MKFWWVNHSQSFRAELAGGYIWCPQVRPGRVQRTPWLNVARVLPGDMIISYAKQHVRAVGVAQTAAFDSPPKAGYAEKGWKDLGWEVTVQWEMLPVPFSLKPFVETITPFLASKNAPLKTNGDAQLAYLTSISREFGDWLIRNVGVNEALVLDLAVEAEVNAENVPPTEKVRLYQARLGQGTYRREVLQLEPRCRLTGVSDPNFLIASHIKPWRDSSNSERLDRHNGLMLAPHVDRLFDQGWISFEDSGDMLIVSEIEPVISAWGLTSQSNVGAFSRQTAGYLEFHRNEVFRRALKRA